LAIKYEQPPPAAVSGTGAILSTRTPDLSEMILQLRISMNPNHAALPGHQLECPCLTLSSSPEELELQTTQPSLLELLSIVFTIAIMRLLDTKTLEFHEFNQSQLPEYAILSHTWRQGEEVTFQEMLSKDRELKNGFAKIKNTCSVARKDDLAYAWVDTCCIDKSSSAELSEAINCMYQWYSDANRCYVYLDDLAAGHNRDKNLPDCRWFTRGWTLQELLAPKKASRVGFYDKDWHYRGSKQRLSSIISTCTGIRKEVLLKKVALKDCSVAERMSWAARRETTRTEDRAYCLLGVFDVAMPLLYGEGTKSFQRLQAEIVKHNNDLTIFAWEASGLRDENTIRLFAESPAAFIGGSLIAPFPDDLVDFSITNKGVLVSEAGSLRVVATKTKGGDQIMRYSLFVGTSSISSDLPLGGLYLRKIGPKLFVRDLTLPLAGFGSNAFRTVRGRDASNYYIVTAPKMNVHVSKMRFREGAVYIPVDDRFEIQDTVPEALWDVTDRVFLKPKPFDYMRYPMAIAIAFYGTLSGVRVDLVVLCDYREGLGDSPICRVFWKGDYPREESMIFQERNRTDGIYWSQLELDAPNILKLKDRVKKTIQGQVYRVAVAFEKRVVPSISDQHQLFHLKFDVTKSLSLEQVLKIELDKKIKAIQDAKKKGEVTYDDYMTLVTTRTSKRKR
jgi:hypothetical protein